MMTISVIVPTYNRPDFVELQYLLIKKYLKEDFEYFLYDNSDRPECTEAFAEISKRLGINYLRIDQGYRAQIGADASRGAGYSLDYAIDHNIENYNRPCLVLDSDLFLFDYFEVLSKFDEADLWGIGQANGPVRYYNNQLLLLNIEKLPNLKGYSPFTPDTVEGLWCDCGGRLHSYIKENNIRHMGLNQIFTGAVMLSEDGKNLKWPPGEEIAHREVGSAGNVLYFDGQSDSLLTDKPLNVPEILVAYYLKEIEICNKFSEEGKLPYGKAFSEIFADKFLHFRAGSNWIGHKNEMVIERTKLLIEFGRKLLQ